MVLRNTDYETLGKFKVSCLKPLLFGYIHMCINISCDVIIIIYFRLHPSTRRKEVVFDVSWKQNHD